MTLTEKLKRLISEQTSTETIQILENALCEIERIEKKEYLENKIQELQMVQIAEPEVLQAIPSEIRYYQRRLAELEN